MRMVIWVVVVSTILKGDTVLRESIRDGVKRKAVLVTSGPFTETYVEQLSRRELSRRPRVKFSLLQAYAAQSGAPLPKPAHITYQYWRGLYESQMRTANELAEMISIGGDAVLRMRDGTGKLTRRVLAGRDPLQIGIGESHFEIVYISFSGSGPYTSQWVHVYVRTAASLAAETGLELFRILKSLFPDWDVLVFVRNDAWFVYEPSYPFFNPFCEKLEPPTQEEYSKTRTLKCGYWSGSTACRLN